MLIGIIILICAITVVYVFRRHGNSLGLQQGKDTLSLPVIEFDEYEDKYGDELKAQIDEAYKLWYYGEDDYNIYQKVSDYRTALRRFKAHSGNYMIDIAATGFNRTFDRAIKYEWGKPIYIEMSAIHYEEVRCDEILDSIERKAKHRHGILNTPKYYQ